MCDSKTPDLLYMVIEEDVEESFSTVISSDVIYDEDTIIVGDEVNFYWESRKKPLIGRLRYMSADFDKCWELSKKMSKERREKARHQPSCHKNESRRSASKSNNDVLTKLRTRPAPVPAEKKEKSNKKVDNKVKMSPIANKRLLAKAAKERKVVKGTKRQQKDGSAFSCRKRAKAEEDSSSMSNQSSSSDEDDSKEARKLKKLANELAQKLDYKSLKQLLAKSSEKQTPGSTSNDTEGKRESPTVIDDSSIDSLDLNVGFKLPHDANDLVQDPDDRNQSDLEDTSCGNKEDKDNVNIGSQLVESKVNSDDQQESKKKLRKYDGEMFLVNTPDDKAAAVKLADNEEVYCTKRIYRWAEESNSATQVVRRLVVGVFTEEALLNSSVSGLPPRGKGKDAYTSNPSVVRKYLCPKAIDVIIDKALHLQKSKHLKPKKASAQLRQTLGVRLCEIRRRGGVGGLLQL